MKCTFNVRNTGTSDCILICGDSEFTASYGESKITFDIPFPGEYTFRIVQIPPKADSLSILEFVATPILSVFLILFFLYFEIADMGWIFKPTKSRRSWLLAANPYRAETTLKLYICNDRKIHVTLNDSAFNEKSGKWNKKLIHVNNIPAENISTVNFFDENNLKRAYSLYKTKLYLMFFPAIVMFAFLTFLSVLSNNIIAILLSAIALVACTALCVCKLKRENKNYLSKLIQK